MTSHVRNHIRMAQTFSCAHNCTARDTREAGITFYRIPAKETLWLNAIGRKNFNPKPHTVICSQEVSIKRPWYDPIRTVYCTVLLLGRKSGHLPTLLVYFHSRHLQKREEQNRAWNVMRYIAKRRRQEKDRTEAADALEALASTTDDVHYPPDMGTYSDYLDSS